MEISNPQPNRWHRSLVPLIHTGSIDLHDRPNLACQLSHPRSPYRGTHGRGQVRERRIRRQVDLRQRPRTHIRRTLLLLLSLSISNYKQHPQVAYQRILQLTYVEDLLSALKTLFVKLFEPFLATFVASLHAIHTGKVALSEAAASWDFAKAFEGWDKVFDKLLKGLEDKAAQVGRVHPLARV
jgi:hypothetical protein